MTASELIAALQKQHPNDVVYLTKVEHGWDGMPYLVYRDIGRVTVRGTKIVLKIEP